MNTFELDQIERDRARSGEAYLEFFRIPQMSLGVYKIHADEVDKQKPHAEDEVYYVAAGRGMIKVGDEDRLVQSGSIIFVAANVEHRFHSITEDLCLLVFFAPAEGASREKP